MTKKVFKRALNDLIVFSIYSAGDKCTFEELVKECFSRFPEYFSFPKIKKWPDARKLDRPLRTLRERKLIKGGPKTYFSLTKLGKDKAKEIAKFFSQGRLKI